MGVQGCSHDERKVGKVSGMKAWLKDEAAIGREVGKTSGNGCLT